MSKNKSSLTLKISSSSGAAHEELISFSFRYMTTNKKHNWDYFAVSQFRDKVKAYDAFIAVMTLLSRKNRIDIIKMSRKDEGGSERIPYNQLNFRAGNDCMALENVRSFRFGKGDYRLIGFWSRQSSVFYIIGFDFDYSAYNHGN